VTGRNFQRAASRRRLRPLALVAEPDEQIVFAQSKLRRLYRKKRPISPFPDR
jgi:hypothetical protein